MPGKEQNELRLYARLLDNAYKDLSPEQREGRLCEEIKGSGLEQELVINETIYAKGRVPRGERLLAARVCESCTQWLGCNNYKPAELPMDPRDRFSVTPRRHDGMQPQWDIDVTPPNNRKQKAYNRPVARRAKEIK